MDRAFLGGMLKDWGIAFAVLAAGLFVWMVFFASKPLSEGPAPDFTLPTLDGAQMSLTDMGSGPVVLNFWFPSCGPCRQELPELSAFQQAHPEIPILGISVDTMGTSQLRNVVRRLPISFTVLHDQKGDVAGTYQVSTFPTTIIINEQEIRASRVGTVDQRRLIRMLSQAGHNL